MRWSILATVVAVFAHPDDETFICGGTLAKLSAAGHRVVLICATLGEMGRRMGIPPSATRESIARTREAELREACDALSVSRLELLHVRDKTVEIQPEAELAKRVLDVFEEEKPSAVITFHEELGGHADHCAMGRIATLAYGSYVERGADSRLFYVAWSDNVGLFNHYPQLVQGPVIIDVRAHKAAKLAAFRAHRTQSQLNKSIWGSDSQSTNQMSDTEVFIHSQGLPMPKSGSLLNERGE